MKYILTVVLAAALLVAAPNKNDAERMLKAAQNAELVDGDLKGAIEQYDAIVAKFANSHRDIAADALMRMAECHAKLGNAEARKIYARVIKDYSDQKEAVAVAQSRLADADAGESAKGDRVVWAGENALHVCGSVSRDGRYVSYTDWFYTGNLMLRDLSSGKSRPLTPKKDWEGEGNAVSSTFSPDGKRVAYAWTNYEPRQAEIRVVDIKRTGVPEPRKIFSSQEIRGITPSDWSSDGEWLAVDVGRQDNSGQIGVVGVSDGSLRVLKTVGRRGPKKLFFSTDGKYIAYDLPANDTEVQRDVFVIAVDGGNETKVVVHPASDAVMGWSPDGGQLLFASDRTGSNALMALPIADGKSKGAPVLLKPDIGPVSSLGLTASGALHVFKDTSTLALHIAPIDLEAGTMGTPVVESYRAARPDWSRDGKYLAYKKGDIGDFVLAIRNVESGELREIPTSLNYFSEPRWSPDGRWLAAGARPFKGKRAIYRFDVESGEVTFLAPGRHVSRVEFSPDGKKIYYGYHPDNESWGEYDLASAETREVFPRNGEGFRIGRAELSTDGRFAAAVSIDLAEKGTRPYGDSYGKYNTLLLFPIEGGEPRELLRVARPERLAAWGGMSWTPDSQAVIVMKTHGDRGKDKEMTRELWLVPINGDKARKLDIDISEWGAGSGAIRLHPDGSQIAFFAGNQSEEIQSLENFLPLLTKVRSPEH